MARRPWRVGQPGDDVPGAHAALVAPQEKALIASELDATARAVWDQEGAGWDAEQVVFLNETSTHTSLTRHRGRAPRGERVVGAVPRNHGPNITCLAALTPTGIAAPLVFEGAVNSQIFGQWLREWLLPQLAPGTRIVCDNLSVHKHADVRPTVAKAGCRLDYLPASSPDLNPIELVFAMLKTHLRRMTSRTFETLVDAIGTGCDQISAADAAAWYQHRGYRFASTNASQAIWKPL